MRSFKFVTVDVFTTRHFGGNPLAVFPDAEGLSDREMQSLAAELNLSETTFVLLPSDRAHTARVRIFNRSSEMAFAGHPNVGTAWVLDRLGRTTRSSLCFEEIAGLVEIRIDKDLVTVDAPEALSLGTEMPVDLFASCVGLRESEIVVSSHRPVLASVGHPFVIGEISADGPFPTSARSTGPRSSTKRRSRTRCLSISTRKKANVCARGCSRPWRAPSRMQRPAARLHRLQVSFSPSLAGRPAASTSCKVSKWVVRVSSSARPRRLHVVSARA
jgi:hypothetical protein